MNVIVFLFIVDYTAERPFFFFFETVFSAGIIFIIIIAIRVHTVA